MTPSDSSPVVDWTEYSNVLYNREYNVAERASLLAPEAAAVGGDDEQVVIGAAAVVDDAGVGDDPALEVGLGDARSRERGGPQALR
jgi:hypothetical protein